MIWYQNSHSRWTQIQVPYPASIMNICSPTTVLRHFSLFSLHHRVNHTVHRIVTPTYFRMTQCTFSTQNQPIVPKIKQRKTSSSQKKEDTTSVVSSEETTFNAVNKKIRKLPSNALSNKVITALETFKHKFGNLMVPARFSIPTNDTTASNDSNTIISKDSSNISSKKKRKGSSDTSPWPTGMHA
jgi:hypothetical protein